MSLLSRKTRELFYNHFKLCLGPRACVKKMSGSRLQQKLLTNTFRSFHRNTIFRDKKSTEISSTASKNVQKKEEGQVNLPGSETINHSPLGPMMYTPKTLDKWLLVWHKKYKSVADVPYQVREETISQIHSKSRIQVANFLMVFILCCCGFAVWSGKKEAQTGDSLQKRILERNERLRADYLAELEKQKDT